jgi:hypothetical protein
MEEEAAHKSSSPASSAVVARGGSRGGGSGGGDRCGGGGERWGVFRDKGSGRMMGGDSIGDKGTGRMNRAEDFVQKALVRQGWNASHITSPPTSQSITQSTVREVLYTNYERLVSQQLTVVVLMGPDNDVVWSVLQLHPRKVQKIGSGISLFVLSRNVMNKKTPGFFVARTDGTVVDFAIKKCFAGLPKGDETSWRCIMNRLTASGDFPRHKHQMMKEGQEASVDKNDEKILLDCCWDAYEGEEEDIKQMDDGQGTCIHNHKQMKRANKKAQRLSGETRDAWW